MKIYVSGLGRVRLSEVELGKAYCFINIGVCDYLWSAQSAL